MGTWLSLVATFVLGAASMIPNAPIILREALLFASLGSLVGFVWFALGRLFSRSSAENRLIRRRLRARERAAKLAACGAMGLAVIVAIPTIHSWYVSPPLIPVVFIECEIPIGHGPETHAYILHLSPDETDLGLVQLRFPTPQNIITGTPFYARRCRATSYGSTPLFNVSTTLRVDFKTPVKSNGGLRSGATVRTREWQIKASKIDPGASGAFVFYVVNKSKWFATGTVAASAEGETDDRVLRPVKVDGSRSNLLLAPER